MTNKTAIQVLTILFIAALAGALYWSWGQTRRLQALNEDLNSLNATLENKSDSLEAVNSKLKNERDGYVKLFSSSKEYEEAKEKNTPEAYYEYVKNVGAQNFGDTRIISEISDKLNALMNETGFVQIMESNGNYLFEEKEKLFPDYDFYIAKSDRTVRNGVIGNPSYPNTSRNGDAILQGQIVNVVEIIGAGDAAWAKISYYSD